MFLDDIHLVEEMTAKYGLKLPFVDLGGLRAKDITVADYERTIKTGDQHARYLKLDANPFEHIAPGYEIVNPEYGNRCIEDLPEQWGYPPFGTIVCLSTLEHVKNPFQVFDAFYTLLQTDGLLILSTVFSFPVHGAPSDYWRFTPECLKMLAMNSALRILESGFRLDIPGDAGIKEIHTGMAQEIKSVYLVARK